MTATTLKHNHKPHIAKMGLALYMRYPFLTKSSHCCDAPALPSSDTDPQYYMCSACFSVCSPLDISPTSPAKCYDSATAAKILRVDQKFLRWEITMKRITPFKSGQRSFFPFAEIEQYIAQRDTNKKRKKKPSNPRLEKVIHTIIKGD